MTKEGIHDQNDDNDIDEPQDILEDADNDNDDDNDNEDDSFLFNIGLEHYISALMKSALH